MVAKSDSSFDHSTLAVEAVPSEVDAGAKFTLTCRVAAPPAGSDPSGLGVSIRSHDNADLAFAELLISDGDYVTDEILLNAPLTEGEHIFRAVLVAGRNAGASRDMTSTEFSLVVRAHAMRLNVWDLPTAIVAGARFTLKAGIKCSSGCNLAGREFSVADGDGNQIGTGKLRDHVWPGTSALYFAEVEGKAPLATGNHKWEVRIPAPESGVPHAAGVLAFDVKIVGAPDFEVTIEAFDSGTQVPIANGRVVMHPYRALTDANGVATLKVAKGTYKLLVSASKYLATATTVEVAENSTIRAELSLEPVVDPASYYV